MSTTDLDPEDAITKEEISGTAPAPSENAGVGNSKPQRNAFTELMAPKPKAAAPPKQDSSKPRSFRDRDGLGAYTANPTNYPSNRVIYHNDDFVAINDLYPKSTVHTLLLPRSDRSRLHPVEALEDPQFLASVQAETLKLKKLVAKELQRRYGKFSEADKQREAVLNGEAEWDSPELPNGRDWEAEVLVGIHAHPSMNDLHVHVLSRDMISECMRHRKHFNSFNSPFLVDVADFPLAKHDPRRHPGREGYLDRDLLCWRCGENFGNRFKRLKEHLDIEFEAWKKQ
ncbi:HIT domain-containing protein [Pseudomassariella vexata]|uniref:Aprataxin-like protein n=1 Tax=Pseudomassariella vexata TaxID=1141098 RepID=A0A1Y2EKL7_9PEZI|nr:HIT domain-containing protein [Pseudomassariella vexata]ORY71844.1 HIT domain-containing protein [Pseudomassariella vexata]